jgi:hypothetical protein
MFNRHDPTYSILFYSPSPEYTAACCGELHLRIENFPNPRIIKGILEYGIRKRVPQGPIIPFFLDSIIPLSGPPSRPYPSIR